jgi:hypothetical protein
MISATNQKSQYGFGGNHTVPSVPAPPPMSITHIGQSHKIGIKPPLALPTMPNLPNMPNLELHNMTPANAGAAYERKKQRAKDARIKLNDAIEHLAIGISLAGSQSKQRNALLISRISVTESRNKTIKISEECSKLAEQAKKWDRPSFVGTAASLVHGLNSQCESLMRELVGVQEQLDAATGGGDSSSAPMNVDPLTSHPELKREDHPVSSVNGELCHATKRMRAVSVKDKNMNGSNEGQVHHVDVPSDENTIFGGVATMLDPVSLSRCPYVSRRWRDMGVFDDDDTWLNLAVKRFGFYNVRQWTEKLEDSDSGGKTLSKKSLYRAMNAANVMPHIQQECISLLGDAKIPGRVSGWVFIVERSNGETLRSVKREPESSAAGNGERLRSVKHESESSAAGNGAYQSRPVVELRIVVQNTGMANYPIVLRDQQVAVDISTRRSGGELKEIHWDERFSKVLKSLDGAVRELPVKQSKYDVQGELCRLNLFDAIVLEVHINARGCSTTSKFQQRSNFTKLLVCLDGTTVPMVIPFLRDGSHGNH